MKRRDFLRISSAAVGSTVASGSAWAALIEKALALTPHDPTGTPGLADVEHVIIFMQENRSFDHYFGSANGVRGFGDPRPTPIPSGNYVWYQAEGTDPASRGFSADVAVANWNAPATWYEKNRTTQSNRYVLPFRLNRTEDIAYQYLGDLNHSWKQAQDIWSNWDSWVPLKSRQSMGFLNATDLPFYHQLSAAFTICDAYHCSVFGPTDPNRFYLWSGTCPPPMNFPDSYTAGYVADILRDDNKAITPAMYGQSPLARRAAVSAGVADWPTYAETLSENRITWKIYQELDNYGDNYLQYFKNFRIDNSGAPISESTDPHFQTLYQRGRVFAAPSADVGDALIEKFARDVAAGMEPDAAPPGVVRPGLPRVSWIVAPYKFCEHPSASPGDGEAFTARLLEVLVNRHPEVFRKAVCLLTYDENDGYFDHVPPPIPATSARYGQMTLADAGAAETMSAIPVGLGPRVPMLVISPWTKGGRVGSQVYDHTSVIRFLEQWLTAKRLASAEANRCTLISPWRRSICGDLTELFDFSKPSSSARIDTETTFKNGLVPASVPSPQAFPALPSAVTRDACALGYSLALRGSLVEGRRYGPHFVNSGSSGAVFTAYWMPMTDVQTTFYYSLEAGTSLSASPVRASADGLYDWAVHGPNGWLREFRGSVDAHGPFGRAPEVMLEALDGSGDIRLVLDNRNSSATRRFHIVDLAYGANDPAEIEVTGGRTAELSWVGVSGWHDVGIRITGDASYFRRVAGCQQPTSGRLITDPAAANTRLFKPVFTVQQELPDSVRFDYSTPPWHHRPQNWIGLFAADAPPTRGSELTGVYAPRGAGSVIASTSMLSPGHYDAWYLFDDGPAPLAGPLQFHLKRGS